MDEMDDKDKRIQMLEISLKWAQNRKWHERYLDLYAIHIKMIKHLREVRGFRAVNFSIQELEAALEKKKKLEKKDG
jgi:hypothetical protein